MKYRTDIDGLRALAILLVTIFHFDLLSSGKAGFIGVDVFFVISGFLITTIIVRDLQEGCFRIGNFLYKRFRRLYSALTLTLLLYVGAGYFFLLPDMYRELGLEALLSQLYVVNFYFWRNVNYFGLQAGSVPLLHMWSLSVEEQFYFLFPVFCLLVYRVRPTWLFTAVVIVTLISFVLGVIMTPLKTWASFYLLPTRAWELLLGSILSISCLKWPPRGNWLILCGPLGLGLIAVSIFLYTPLTLIPGWFALLPSLGAVFLLLGGYNQEALVTRMMSVRALVWIGLISYPLYLVHWPIMILIKENVQTFTLEWRLTGFCLSFVLAWMIYQFVERPIRTGRWLGNPRDFLAVFGGSSAVMIATTALIFNINGLPNRFSEQVNLALASQADAATSFRNCIGLMSSIDTLCVLGDPDASPDMLVYGDSHANSYAEAIDIWLTKTGRSAFFTFSPGCLPVTGMGGAQCNLQAQNAIALLADNSFIETVMMISIWRQPYEGGVSHRGQWVSGTAAAEAFVQELEATISDFSHSGAEVVLVEPFFASPQNVPRTLAKNLAFGRDWPVHQSRREYEKTFAQLFEAFERSEELGARRISLVDQFCANDKCDAIVNGRPIFVDNNHVAGWMSQQLSEIFEIQYQLHPG
ncbi:Peptidoglycan/LPS O-acetylase OafA/YrhL, contains acyltransferase and SGNH-hydrolase domains [Cognatiyoonia sediminum]|uniref:Peptidoglycan/LPS O-acetylase OafA/YrhL, contains acyltransferase and SGNH-hydrolase domains n=1 Tax=Cognatiyoonia sediminum TaxID=1508389 RepID=A0A1M5NWG4_9RHOB|nr:acyltransferase family protein [Cognatiyoonia sediminum]SHG93795.1 Peptidoglycan/LPS O-acetylase OafA/YrhL, contains acyltransferase and SGNH-hydrolase domains [Cognatiyoonia sediminum]